MFNLFNCDCLEGAKEHLPDKCLDLQIHDPPFGLGETGFDKLYNRKSEKVLKGYAEAPEDYEAWTRAWLAEAKRTLKDDGAMYVVSGWSKLREVLNAVHDTGLHLINDVIWHFPFGVYTKRKYVSSHYHVLYLAKSKKAPPFNRFCRFADRKAQYADMQDVWAIKKEYHPGKVKNVNKLPEALVEKMIQYSSKPGDWIGDFFMGNFTTAYVGLRLKRHVAGFEINKKAYDHHVDRLIARTKRERAA